MAEQLTLLPHRAEQLPLFNVDPHVIHTHQTSNPEVTAGSEVVSSPYRQIPLPIPRSLELKSHQTANPEIVSGPNGDIILYNVSNDFRGMMNAHKKSYMDKDEAVKSAYTDLIPNLDELPKPDDRFPASPTPEQVVEDGAVSEDVPFMTAIRIARLEKRARAQHRKAQKFLRRVRVAHDAAKGVLTGDLRTKEQKDEGNKEYVKDPIYYSSPDKQYRPQTLLENAAAKRMGRLLMRSNANNSLTNVLEEVTANDDGSPRIVEQDNNGTGDSNLSRFERLHRDSTRQLHDKREERSKRMMEGTRIPIINKRVGLFSFKTLAEGGPGKPRKRAEKALKKRDAAIQKAEALRQPKTIPSEQPTEELPVVPHDEDLYDHDR